jgi:uncharacterized protein (TIGR03382 family)
MKITCAMMMAAVVGCVGAAANAELVTGTITADNHYALYSSAGSTFSFHGGNEMGAGGSPGQYNWSEAESYSFEVGEYLYIAAWSDDSVAQGVLAEFYSDSLGTILSGDPRWEVYGTNVNLGDGSPHPTALDIAGHVNFADTNSLWESTFVGANNGVSPWGTIAGITGSAQWMWKNVIGDSDPLNGGSGASEMLIFRTQVPGPGSLALLALGGVVGRRRRR